MENRAEDFAWNSSWKSPEFKNESYTKQISVAHTCTIGKLLCCVHQYVCIVLQTFQ